MEAILMICNGHFFKGLGQFLSKEKKDEKTNG